ncbi:MAG: hypothetical protein H6722_28130 [Sandaracinus sp.]|jgi:hypothetical protein|nr:hypothetical protein [Sandaracinus sp.]MCB9619230.1 hypothetical protein [Sandaracinus sp.]
MTRSITTTLFLAALTLGSACGGFQLDPVTPSAATDSVRPVGRVVVTLDPAMEEDQRAVCEKKGVAAEMQRVLAQSLSATGGESDARVEVRITSIRHRSFGPSRMHTQTRVVAPDGTVLEEFEQDSTSIRAKAIGRVAQDMVQRVADAI